VLSEGVIDATPHNRCQVELQVAQNMTTSFRPMYYVVGVISSKDMGQLRAEHLRNFEHIFQQLSSTCWFVHCFSTTFQDRLRFSLRKARVRKSVSDHEEEIKEFKSVVEIEELEKRQKQKLFTKDEPQHVFFGFYCSQSEFLSDLKEQKVFIS